METKNIDKKESKDGYAFGMDWGGDKVSIGELTNYRQYQYNLVKKWIGNEVFEVGSGASRSFTKLLVKNQPNIKRLLSIEPSEVLLNEFGSNKESFNFPDYVEFQNKDIFEMKPSETGLFDTLIYIHVLEHIEEDKKALDYSYEFLKPKGKILVEVPALPCLFSVHDKMLGHYRRYNKKMLRNIVDTNKFKIVKLWYNDPIGVLGSFFFFKLRKIELKSEQGVKAVENQGKIYDQYLIPLQEKIEKIVTFPFGLSVNIVIEKK